MYYLWGVGEDYPEEKVDVQYDYKHLDFSLFHEGQLYIEKTKPKFDVRFVRRGKGTMDSLLAMDYSFMGGGLLISKRFADKIEAYCPEDVQMIVPEVWADGQDVGEHFRVMNVLHLVPCMLIDPDKEEYLQPLVFYKEGELTGHHIARSSDLGRVLIVSKSFAEMVYAEKINSVCFNPDNKRPATWNPLWPGIFYRNQKEYMAEVCDACHKPKTPEDQKNSLYHIHNGDWWDLEDRLICCCG
jgi:hypothetical protein